MSHPAPTVRPGEPSETDEPERHVALRVLRRVRAPIVLIPLVIGVLVAASVGAHKLWADIPEKVAPPPDVTCWNNTVAPAAACPQPRGEAGLHWVFPSFKAHDPRCSRVERRRRDTERPLEVACDLRFEQRAVTVTYSVRTSLESGLSFLRRVYGVEPVQVEGGGRLVFRSPRPTVDGTYRATVAYARYPFTVTVEAPELELRDTALDELVAFRRSDRLLVKGPA